ncbi:unnamed protein product [Rotaria sordida]|uniref:Uncharacterized protein n=2 Tax=Rotaria sordida TaxID=392033 RepID=A0A819GZ15_9BILA|nr:unnamed protein product [Rotaria sordida]CAF1395299.1 unnamed protein product [Rotaria sordida]CAF3571449.1 unnamed protein product [Rotaria sordida]CAF3874581.1 unnamed protein product [Rotaria sordida]CAF3894605.1 unnamed protein product [Rotaria sordida]
MTESASSSGNVDMEENQFNHSNVKTTALSTCIGLLLHGSIENQEFCVLSHSSKIDEFDYDDDNIKDLLVYLIQNLKSYMIQHVKIQSINNLKLLVAGGAVDEHLLTRQAFFLLNEDINLNEFKELTKDNDDIYLLKI